MSFDDITMPEPRDGERRVVDFDDLDRDPTDIELGPPTVRVANFDDLDTRPRRTRDPIQDADVSGFVRID